jgi:hypothetical protein
MKDTFQVLREKELDVIRVQREIAALRVVTPILAEETDRLELDLLLLRNSPQQGPQAERRRPVPIP